MIVQEGVTGIPSGAFNNYPNLEKVSIPSTVEAVGGFAGCSSLKELHLSEGVKRILNAAFIGCALTGVDFPSTLESIGLDSFSSTRITEVRIPPNVTQVDESFYYTPVSRVILEEGRTVIPQTVDFFNDFEDGLEVFIPRSVTEIQWDADFSYRWNNEKITFYYYKGSPAEAYFNNIIEKYPNTTCKFVALEEDTSDADVRAFVTRLYENILQRSPDQAGLESWVSVLTSGQESGARVLQNFVGSDEFKERNLSDEEYVQILYRTCLGREADANGLQSWLAVLDSGLSRTHVLKGFAESAEFSAICQDYGITRGNVMLTEARDQNESVTKFVVRCYRLCLGREADVNGLNAWCSQILNGQNTAKQAAYGFVFSREF